MADTDRRKKVTPPYATPAGVRLFFDKIKRVKPPQLTTKWAEDNDLPFADALVNMMKFLGAVDKDGNLKSEFAGLRLDGQKGEEALAPLVTTAYKPVLDQIDDIAIASEDDLNNAFKTAWDVGTPGRYVRPFLVLCELAGLREAPTSADDAPRNVRRRSRGAKATGADGAQRRRSSAGTGGGSGGRAGGGGAGRVPVQLVVRLDVPWDAPIGEVRERIGAITDLVPKDEG